MESNNRIDRYFEAFAECMTPNENGEPLVAIEDLGSVLKAVNIPPDLAPNLTELMDPESTGFITFERFVKVCDDMFGKEPLGGKDRSNEEHIDDGNDYIDDDDSDDESYKEESDHEGYPNKRQAREDKPFSSATDNNETGISPTMAFNVLSQGQDQITVESLAYVNRMINANASRDDLRRMVQLVSSKEDFFKLWK